MPEYIFAGAEKGDYDTIYATHPAQPGTYLGFAARDGTALYDVVVLWGVTSNCTPDPITMDGVWGGVKQANTFIKFPDGRCAKYEQAWPDEAAAIADLGQCEP